MPASATKILIIDDDADLVSLLTDNLQLEGFSPPLPITVRMGC